MNKAPNALLIIPRLRIINANCISGPLTWGFPAPSAFTGFVHALSRRMKSGTVLDGTGIISHLFEPQANTGRYDIRFKLTRNPIYDRDTTKRSGIVEEGRAHLTVSIIAGIYGAEPDIDDIRQAVGSMRIAGGSIVHQKNGIDAEIRTLTQYAEEDEKILRKVRRKLLPGFALTDKTELLTEHLDELKETNPEASPLDAIFSLTALKHEPIHEDNGKTTWKPYREKPGWLVPLPVGYSEISPLYSAGEVRNTRDSETPFRFVEAAYSIGEWVNPLKIDSLSKLLWFHNADPDKGTYLCGHKKLY